MSDPVKFQGSATPIKSTEREIWQRGRGYQTVKRYEGTKSAIRDLKGTLYTGSGGSLESFEMYREGGKYILETYSASKIDGSVNDDDNEAESNPLWELEPEEMETDLRAHPYFSGISADRFDEIEEALNDHTTGDLTLTPQETDYVNMRKKGTDVYLRAAYRLRRTYTVNSRSGLRASFANVNEVDTPNVTGALFDLPSGEWLKLAPVVVKIAKQKWEITQEWLWDTAWSDILYGGTGTP